MENRFALNHLEYIHQVDPSGLEYFGCDQNWFPSEWQQISGCAPSTAATLLVYLQKSGRIQFPIDILGQQDCRLLMESVWTHVTPTMDGIYLIDQFCAGIRSFADANGFALDCHSLHIPEYREDRPSLQQSVDFIRDALAHDSPVAFLNLSNGTVINLEEWHWVTLVALESSSLPEAAFTTVFDGDRSAVIDFRQWLETTVEGGALIWLEVPAAAPATAPAASTAASTDVGSTDRRLLSPT